MGVRVTASARTVDQRLAEVAALQHGVISGQQMRALGLSEGQIRTRVARRQITRVHRGVYMTSHERLTPLAQAAAALLACGEGSVLSHLSALNFWRLLSSPWRVDTVHVLTVRGAGGGRGHPGITVHSTRILPRSHVRLDQRVRVTSPERTLLDCGQLLTARQLESALNEGLGRHITSLSKVRSVMEDHWHAPGRERLAATLAARTTSTVTNQEAEERFLQLIRTAGLPDPHTQVMIEGQSLDAYWPQARFGVEIDSRAWHSSPGKFNRDRRKDQILRDHGITVARTTWEQITEDPLQLIAHVARQLGTGGVRAA